MMTSSRIWAKLVKSNAKLPPSWLPGVLTGSTSELSLLVIMMMLMMVMVMMMVMVVVISCWLCCNVDDDDAVVDYVVDLVGGDYKAGEKPDDDDDLFPKGWEWICSGGCGSSIRRGQFSIFSSHFSSSKLHHLCCLSRSTQSSLGVTGVAMVDWWICLGRGGGNIWWEVIISEMARFCDDLGGGRKHMVRHFSEMLMMGWHVVLFLFLPWKVWIKFLW